MVFEQIIVKGTLSVIFVLSWGSYASAMYDPYIGRFASRDPIGYQAGSNSLLALADSNPESNVDPSGNCKVRLVCTTLGLIKEHCGIEVSTDKGKSWTRWHVNSPGAGVVSADTCDVQPSRIKTPWWMGPMWGWRNEIEWNDPTGALCTCINREAVNIRRQKLPYWPTPGNSVDADCNEKTNCNSNYSTHCMMKRCGITAERNSAPGWNHRMSLCTQKIGNIGEPGKPCTKDCHCGKWEPNDSGWCADEPVPPKIVGVPIT